jgi:hypothetical protein
MFSNILATVYVTMVLTVTRCVDLNNLLLCLPVKMGFRLRAPWSSPKTKLLTLLMMQSMSICTSTPVDPCCEASNFDMCSAMLVITKSILLYCHVMFVSYLFIDYVSHNHIELVYL